MFARLRNLFQATTDDHRAMIAPFPKFHELPEAAPVLGEVVAFYTANSLYEKEAERMVASARRLGLVVATSSITSAGSWVRNAAMKPTFLLAERQKRRGALLYVDVDAVFHRNPWADLAAYDCDIAVYYSAEGELIAATILISDTPAAERLIALWKEKCDANPDIWDQKVLQQILENDAASESPQFRVQCLPVSYCYIFDRITNEPVKQVIIEQLQASREAKQERQRFGRVRKHLNRRRDRVRQIEEILSA
jgi:hypothetical protein